MSEKEVNTITHLLEVEQKAAELTSQAQLDADKKITTAKARADSQFKSEYEKIVAECELDYKQKIATLESKKNEEISSYKAKISKNRQDKEAFTLFLDSVFAK